MLELDLDNKRYDEELKQREQATIAFCAKATEDFRKYTMSEIRVDYDRKNRTANVFQNGSIIRTFDFTDNVVVFAAAEDELSHYLERLDHEFSTMQ